MSIDRRTASSDGVLPGRSPFGVANIRLFIGFRVFFNARFYYPVFTILFLDYGLTLEQFALLNSFWAVTIVLTEVPSGALADLLGRKRLLVVTSLLMVAEMAIIAFIPLGNAGVVFWAFLVNRILSGLAEAMASGADEAIAYDTLKAEGMEKQWPRVLDIQMRLQHLGYLFAMTIGALVYDANTMGRLLHLLGVEGTITRQLTMRFPVYLTLGLALLALLTTLRMRDPRMGDEKLSGESRWARVVSASRLTWEAGGWIMHTPFALAIILIGMSCDHVLRMLVTMTSQYFRLIGLPEASYGLIGSGIALLGLVIPRLARVMVERFSPMTNATVVILVGFGALWGMTLCIPLYGGILPVILVFVGMMMTSFFTSHYLNGITDSSHRATVLSFKGLAFNAAYGLIGILYAGLVDRLRGGAAEEHPAWHASQIADAAFRESLGCFPGYFFLVLVCVILALLIHHRVWGKIVNDRLT